MKRYKFVLETHFQPVQSIRKTAEVQRDKDTRQAIQAAKKKVGDQTGDSFQSTLDKETEKKPTKQDAETASPPKKPEQKPQTPKPKAGNLDIKA